jgi:hypothetical protein
MRNVLTTKTLMAIYSAIGAILIVTYPTTSKVATTHKVESIDWLNIAIGVFGFGGGVAGGVAKYHSSDKYYTPDGLPGRDKAD